MQHRRVSMRDSEADDRLVEECFDRVNPYEKTGTAGDCAAMSRMGKVQELQRNFHFLSIFGFSVALMCSWEASLSVSVVGLVNGGRAGLIWMSLIAWIGYILANTSLAEMGSMAPTSGGQYHWVSEFAPRKHQKVISYLVGWICILGWQTSSAATAYITGTQIQGIIILNYPDYAAQAWHGTLLTSAVAAFSVLFNTVLARKLPFIEGFVVIIHVCGFFGIAVTLWVLSPISDAMSVFTEFKDDGQWGNLGGSTLIGITAAALPLLGGDSAVHMAEEIHDASSTLPCAMIWSTFISGGMSWIMVITYCFCLGDLDNVLQDSTGFPFIQVFYNSTQSIGAATVMATIIVFMWFFSNIPAVATTSRQLYAFARDDAIPFGRWFSYVSPRWNVPVNAIFSTFIFSSLVSLINLVSTTALNSIISLSTSSLLTSYICSIGCMIWRRWAHKPLLPSKFSLGKLGLSINIAAEIFLIAVLVLAFFPPIPNPDLNDLNWTIVIYGVAIIFSMVYYYLYGRYQYVGPVESVLKVD